MEDCRLGQVTGRCPGSAPPMVACNHYSCLRFEGGCPVGFIASPCPLEDVCCTQQDGLPWAWPSSAGPACEHGCNLLEWGLESAEALHPVRVTVDASLSGLIPAPVVCAPDDALNACRGAAPTEVRTAEEALFVAVGRNALFANNAIQMDLWMRGDTPEAHVTLSSYTDVPSLAFRGCQNDANPRVVRADLRISELPPSDDTHGRLDLELDNGATVRAEF